MINNKKKTLFTVVVNHFQFVATSRITCNGCAHTLLPYLAFEILKILIYYGLFFKCHFVYLDDLLIKFVLWWEFLVSELN